MKLNYRQNEPLGKHIQLVDKRNTENVSNRVLGININKYFMPSVANVIGTDLSRYKMLRKGMFACNPMHVGRDERLPIALYEEDQPAIVSPAYFTFEIIDSSKLNADYLMLWFRRHEFDRVCWFKTDGSVRGGITWDELCKVELPVLPYEEQLKIVNEFKVITDRIAIKEQINKNLEQQAKLIYQQMFLKVQSQDQNKGALSDIAIVTMGQSPNGSSYNEEGNGTIFFQGRAEFGLRFPTHRLYTTEPKRMALKNDVLMSVRAPVGDINIAIENCCIGRGLSSIRSRDNHQSFVLYTMFALRSQLDVFNGEGTVFGSINRDALNSMPVVIPSKDKMNEFEKLVSPIDAAILQNYEGICKLNQLRNVLISQLMSWKIDLSTF